MSDDATLAGELERCNRIRKCQHPGNIEALGYGYALCTDCGALLPDEDPDLRSKCK